MSKIGNYIMHGQKIYGFSIFHSHKYNSLNYINSTPFLLVLIILLDENIIYFVLGASVKCSLKIWSDVFLYDNVIIYSAYMCIIVMLIMLIKCDTFLLLFFIVYITKDNM